MDINKQPYKLSELAGMVILIVNVASKCKLADNSYKELAGLLDQYYSDGLRVLLFPCKQFLNQEYDKMDEVKNFVKNYGDKFVLMDEVNVKGSNIHPLFKYLIKNLSGTLTNDIKWNFTYFLIDRYGRPKKRYGPTDSISKTDSALLECLKEKSEESIPQKGL